MGTDGSSVDGLLSEAVTGDRSAISRLLERYRTRLKHLVAARLDRRLAVRVDPSDVVQEALIDADRRLPEYLQDRAVGFFPWLWQLAVQRLVTSRRVHVEADKRSVRRELAHHGLSAERLFGGIIQSDTSPSEHVIREEDRARARVAIAALAESDRTILDLRYIQGLPFAEIAGRLGIGIGAVKMRHLRAIERARAAIEHSVTDQ
jgi:RNA polymerase sigma-70 factor (ECF subfamily)